MSVSKLTLQTKNLAALKANLRQYGVEAVERAKAVVQESGGRQYQRTADLCPKRTFFMVEHLRYEPSPAGLAYQVGWNEKDFIGKVNPATGELIRSFYPLYQEFGTRFHPAQPSLFPARDEEAPRFLKNLALALAPRG